jgi:hypothetical protein
MPDAASSTTTHRPAGTPSADAAARKIPGSGLAAVAIVFWCLLN